jgi:hypothetical protein
MALCLKAAGPCQMANENRGSDLRAISPQIICRLWVRNFYSRERLRARFLGSFFDLRSGILIFPHHYQVSSTTKIYSHFETSFLRILKHKVEICHPHLTSMHLLISEPACTSKSVMADDESLLKHRRGGCAVADCHKRRGTSRPFYGESDVTENLEYGRGIMCSKHYTAHRKHQLV